MGITAIINNTPEDVATWSGRFVAEVILQYYLTYHPTPCHMQMNGIINQFTKAKAERELSADQRSVGLAARDEMRRDIKLVLVCRFAQQT